MKIGINARFLTEPYTGIGQYTVNLLAGLSEVDTDTDNEYVLVVPHKPPKATLATLSKNFTIHVLPEKKLPHAGLRKMWWEQRQLPAFFREKNVDLIHHLYPANSLLMKAKKATKIPEIVTVHDVIPWVMPSYRTKLRTRIYQAMTRRALQKAHKIITVSEETQNDLKKHLDIPRARTVMIYNAPAAGYNQEIPAATIEKIRTIYHIDRRPFLLYAGGFDQRKNVDTLIEVFTKEIAPFHQIDLVLVGGKVRQSKLYQAFDTAVNLHKKQENDIKIEQSGKVILTGFIHENKLAALYQSCLAFCHLSWKEGFNIPLIEAAAGSAALLASDIPVHREILGSAALFAEPNSAAHITQQLKRIIEDEDLRFRLKQKSHTQSMKYSWEKAAQAVLKLYKNS